MCCTFTSNTSKPEYPYACRCFQLFYLLSKKKETKCASSAVYVLCCNVVQVIREIDKDYQLCLEAKGGIGISCMSQVSEQ